MAGIVVLDPTTVEVVPGTEAVCAVRLRNTGTVVDQFSLSVLGDAAAWTTVEPPALTLFPSAEGTAIVHFRPPRNANVRAGDLDFAIRSVASQDADGSVVEEGTLAIGAFTDLSARITPRTSEGKRSAHHEIIIENKGNAGFSVELEAMDPDELLAFSLKPPRLDVPSGSSAHAQVKVASRKGFMRGPAHNRPFTVDVKPDSPDPTTLPVRLDANFNQRAGLPAFLMPLIVAAIAIALIVAFVPMLKGSGTFSLTGDRHTTTTQAAAGDGTDAGATTAEAAAGNAGGGSQGAASGAPGSTGGATAAGDAGGVTDAGGATAVAGTGSGGGTSGGGTSGGGAVAAAGGAAAAGGGGTSSGGATTTTPASSGGATTTTPKAATTTTTAPPTTTTTTAAPASTAYQRFVGVWAGNSGTRLNIASDGTTIELKASHDCTAFPSKGCTSSYGGSTPASDADNNDISISYKCGFGTCTETLVYGRTRSGDQLTGNGSEIFTRG